jgi:hypothetical protein
MKKITCKEVSVDAQNWMRIAVCDEKKMVCTLVEAEIYPFKRVLIIEVDDEINLEQLL